MENKKEKGIINWFLNLTAKGLLRVILVVFIIILIILSISFIPRILARTSSSFSAALYSIFVPAENATVTANKKIVDSGEDFNISFKKGDATDGFFTVSYSCEYDIELLSVESSGLKRVDCDTRYYLLDNETSIQLRAITNESLVRLAITGAFENNVNQKIEDVGVIRVTAKNDALGTVVVVPPTEEPTTPAPITPVTPPYVAPAPTPIQPIYYGKADLAIRVLQVGKLSSGTNFITNQTQFRYSDTVGIKFEIRNDGDTNTGPWTFSASLPSLSNPTFNSATQVSLRPGEKIIFTLGFSSLTNQYSNLILINADSHNNVSESSEYNNLATQSIINLDYNSNYYNNNTYNNNGCYVNGIFTYNCYNYNYNNLQVSCYANPSDPQTDERVRWYVNVYGGDGNYDYDWTGTNSLDSSSQNPSKTYTSSGTKRATVTVTDGDDNEATATCSVYVD